MGLHGQHLYWGSRRLHGSCVHAPPAHGRARGAPRADGPPALLAAWAHPDVIPLDFELPDIPRDELLRRLTREPETAWIPVVVVSGEPDVADRVPRDGATGAVTIVRKPVGGAELCTVVDLVLEDRTGATADERGATRSESQGLLHQQRELLYRVISTGSAPLVRQVFRRLAADRKCRRKPPQAPSWNEIARSGRQEGLLNDGERVLLAGGPAMVAAAP
jgi:CheY-like chemotaxis protein